MLGCGATPPALAPVPRAKAHVVAAVPVVVDAPSCRALPQNDTATAAELQRFELAIESSPDRASLAEVGRSRGWLGTVARAHLAVDATEPERRAARLAIEELAGDRGVLELIQLPASLSVGSASDWEATPLQGGALLEVGRRQKRVTDSQFRPRIELRALNVHASADARWVASWEGSKASVFHAASGTEVLVLACDREIEDAKLAPGAVVLQLGTPPTTLPFSLPEASPPAAAAPLPAGWAARALVPGSNELSLHSEGSAIAISIGDQLLSLDLASQTVEAFKSPALRARGFDSSTINLKTRSLLAGQALVSLVRDTQTSIGRPGSARVVASKLSPSGNFVAIRKPIGPWNGLATLYRVGAPQQPLAEFEQLGVVFFDYDDNFCFIDLHGLLMRFNPRQGTLQPWAERPLDSAVGLSSSSGRHFIVWQGIEGKTAVVSLATSLLTARESIYEQEPDADELLLDITAKREVALFQRNPGYSLQVGERELYGFDARFARFVPETEDVALLNHGGSVEVRTLNGELRAQAVFMAEGYVVRGAALQERGQLDMSRLTCRVGRVFLPPELCRTRL
jgi:hypothetical protein